uniref:Variant surface glycoprotein n=1 Tax=Trypanosoma brucei TaxID=5691 RepID=A0A1V0FYJ6_9TRYP|nr:variant surface glycoprotein [Trypanosoma brucei]
MTARKLARRTAVFLFLLLPFTSGDGSPIKTKDELADACESVCHEQLYLAELAKLLKHGNEERTTNLEQISTDAQKYKKAAAIADSMDKRCLYMALYHKFRRLHQENKAWVEQANGDVKAALLAISERIGVLKATKGLEKTTLKLDANSVHGNGNADNNIRIKLTPTTGSQELCTAVSQLTNNRKTRQDKADATEERKVFG